MTAGVWRRLRAAGLNLALCAGSLVFALAALEIAARVYAARLEARPLTTRGSIIRYHPTLGWDKPPHASAWLMRPEYQVFLQLNSHGLRGPEIGYAKPAGVTRVLLLGDSFTEGYTVAEPDSVRAVLERQLAALAGPVQVINAGTIGYSTDQQYLFYSEEGRRYQPDVVVVLFFYNDLYGNTPANDKKPYFDLAGGHLALRNSPVPVPRERERRPESRPSKQEPWRGSMALRLLATRTEAGSPRLHAWLAGWGLAPPAPRERALPDFWPLGPGHKREVDDMWQRTAAILRELAQATARDGARLLVFQVPEQAEVDERAWRLTRQRYSLGPGWRWEKVSERLRRVCQDAGIAHLAPIEAFRAAVETEGPTHFQEDGHWNERGHALAGREIAVFLSRHGWVTGQRATR